MSDKQTATGYIPVWTAVEALHHTLQATLADALALHGSVTLEEYTVLRLLADAESRELKMSEVADASGVSNSGATRLIARIELRGLIERSICIDDRRCVIATLTQSGTAFLKELESTVNAAIELALSGYSVDDRTTLSRALNV